jgi:hypothetical protein
MPGSGSSPTTKSIAGPSAAVRNVAWPRVCNTAAVPGRVSGAPGTASGAASARPTNTGPQTGDVARPCAAAGNSTAAFAGAKGARTDGTGEAADCSRACRGAIEGDCRAG